MNEAQKTFISIIKDYFHSTSHPYVISDELLRYAKIHEVQAIFYKQTMDQRLLHSYSSTIYYYQNRLSVLKNLDCILKNYDYFIVKGVVVAKYYPDPQLRSMGDTDIIVRYNNKQEIAKKLQMAGFIFKDTSSAAEWHFYKSNLNFELHHALQYGSEATNKYVHFFSDCFEHVVDKALTPNYHFVYLLIHLRQHLVGCGVGFRQFMDIAVFYKAVDDWQQVIEWLKEIDLMQFAAVVTEFIYRWWDIDCPLRKVISDEFYEIATVSIFQNGVFGFENENMRKDTLVKTNNHWTTNIIRRIFPPINVFQHYIGYEFLNKSKLLYPVAVIKHIMNHFKSKAQYMKKYQNQIPSKEYVSERKAYLRSWEIH